MHLEHLVEDRVWVTPVLADAVALLGDVGQPWESKYLAYIRAMADQYRRVFLLLGNHEFYGDSYHGTKAKVRKALRTLPDGFAGPGGNNASARVVLMDRTSVVYQGVRLLGATLWSHIPANRTAVVQQFISDYNNIYRAERRDAQLPPLAFNSPAVSRGNFTGEEDEQPAPDDSRRQEVRELVLEVSMLAQRLRAPFAVTPRDTTALHEGAVAWLEEELRKADAAGEVAVVLTHHTPVRNIGRRVFFPEEDEPRSPLSSFLGTNLLPLVERHPSLHTWAFGHTHQSCDFVFQYDDGRQVRFLSNQVGYPNELASGKSAFNRNLVLGIPLPLPTRGERKQDGSSLHASTGPSTPGTHAGQPSASYSRDTQKGTAASASAAERDAAAPAPSDPGGAPAARITASWPPLWGPPPPVLTAAHVPPPEPEQWAVPTQGGGAYDAQLYSMFLDTEAGGWDADVGTDNALQLPYGDGEGTDAQGVDVDVSSLRFDAP